MISSAFIALASFALSLVIAVFPTSSGFPPEFADSVSFIAGYAGMFDSLVPLATLVSAVTILLSVELIVLTFKGTKWLFGHLPFIGGRG